MNTNHDNEATQYMGADNETTQLENTQTQAPASNNEATTKPQKKGWKKLAVGAGSGLLIGGLATTLMSMTPADAANTPADNHKDQLSNPDWVDDKVQVATGVNDDMTFDEAFAAAREEVGAGGCFEWHGKVYGTYIADEWNNMTAEEQAAYADHFSWNHFDHADNSVAQHAATANPAATSVGHTAPDAPSVTWETVQTTNGETAQTTTGETAQTAQTTTTATGETATSTEGTTDGEVVVESVTTETTGTTTAESTEANTEVEVVASGDEVAVVATETAETTAPAEVAQEEEVVAVTEEAHYVALNDSDVEILGVVHDDESGVNIGGLSVDGQEVILVDVNGDMEFEYLATDVNHNGQLDEGEVADIQSAGISVDDLGGFSATGADAHFTADTQDFSDDVTYDI